MMIADVPQTEVLNSPPVSSIPKSIMRAPPLDPASPTPGHMYLPIPGSSARLKTGQGLAPNTDIGDRFPPDKGNLSEQELDAYFLAYEASIKELEGLLAGQMEKVNRRTLSHLSALGTD